LIYDWKKDIKRTWYIPLWTSRTW